MKCVQLVPQRDVTSVVGKPAFLGLLNQLTAKTKPNHLVRGFRGADLWPLNLGAVRAERIIGQQDKEQSSSSGQAEEAMLRKLLQEAIVNAIAQPFPEENRQCLENSKRKKKRVQAKHGQVLTEEEAVERLHQEELMGNRSLGMEKTGPSSKSKKTSA